MAYRPSLFCSGTKQDRNQLQQTQSLEWIRAIYVSKNHKDVEFSFYLSWILDFMLQINAFIEVWVGIRSCFGLKWLGIVSTGLHKQGLKMARDALKWSSGIALAECCNAASNSGLWLDSWLPKQPHTIIEAVTQMNSQISHTATTFRLFSFSFVYFLYSL